LAYLFNRGEIGANQYTIEHKANIPAQEFSRFKGFLEDLCTKSCISKYEEETGGEKKESRTKYVITQKGRETVNIYRHPHIQQIFGSIEDLFGHDDNR
jgi:predicted transcriptional regulator